MDLMQVRRRMIVQTKKSRLPKEYQEVEYIQSTGTQYITLFDTLYIDKPFNLICQSDAITNTTVIFGYGASSGRWFGTYNGTYAVSATEGWNGVSISDRITATISYKTNGGILVDIDGVVMSTGYVGQRRALTLFSGQGSSSWFPASVKIFSLTSDGIIDLVPCCRKSDGEIGMYDLVSNTFFTNQGTGTFLKGADV